MLHGTQGQVSPFEVDELRKETVGGWRGEKKRRLPSEEMRTVASFSTVSSSPSTSVAYRKEHKGCLGIKNRPSQLVRSASSLFFPLYIYNHTTISPPPPKKKNVFPLKYYHPFPYSSEGGGRFHGFDDRNTLA